MDVQQMTKGRVLEHHLDGTELHIGSPAQVIDLAARERDAEVVIGLRADAAGGLDPEGDLHAATIIIPPRRYELGEVTEESDGETITYQDHVAQPLNLAAVTLQLYGLPELPTENEE
jgi:hypothetical protein